MLAPLHLGSAPISAQQSAPKAGFLIRNAWWLSALVAFTLCALAHWKYYFWAAPAEGGDFGANGLQITAAAHFRDLLGNYSRFGFHHPGPAFFYVYAVGEAVWFDLLRICHSPGAAHSLTGLILQSLFYGAGIHVFARFFSSTRALLAATAASCAHLLLTRYCFVSIWPPHQIGMPFFAMVMAGIGVAAGEQAYLPLLVLSGGFCLHGHVAQPLFVGPIVAYAVLAGIAQRRSWDRGAALAAGLIAIVFAVPLVVDAAHGRASNIGAIWRHARSTPAICNSFGSVLKYYLGFVRYWGIQDVPSGGLWQNIRADGWLLVLWTVIGGFPILWMLTEARYSRPAEGGNGADRLEFVRAALGIGGLACVLAIVWGIRMDGPMYSFNSFFAYSIMAVPLAISAGLLAWKVRVPRWSACGIGLGVVGVLWAEAKSMPIPQDSGVSIVRVDQVLREAAAQRGGRTLKDYRFVYLNFDDPPAWAETVMLANRLERKGVPWRVQPGWSLTFGPGRVLAAGDERDLPHALWLQVRESAAPPSPNATALKPGVYVTALNQKPTLLDPSRFPATYPIESPLYRTAAGLEQQEPGADYRWSLGPVTVIPIKVLPARRDVVVSVYLYPLTKAGPLPQQAFNVEFGVKSLGRYALRAPATVKLRIPFAAWNAAVGKDQVDLTFHWENAVAPALVGLNADPRTLAVQFRTTTFSGTQ